MMIDIKNGYRQFSSTELREMAYQGVLECGGYELSDFIEYIFRDYKDGLSEEEVEAIKDEYYDDGWKAAKREAVSAVESI